MTVALVTGSHGWAGGYLRAALVDRGYQVVGLGRAVRVPAAGERYLQVDLLDRDRVAAAVAEVRPDVVFHLAAATPQRVPDAEALVADCVLATHNLCLAMRSARDPIRLVLAGSSAQYGLIDRAHNPIGEDTAPAPVGVYGHAKAAAEAVAYALAADGRIDLVAARAFNHVGPGESAATVAGALARKVADLAAGRVERITAADLDAVRDFTDVRDVAEAYIALAENGETNGKYNICSGRPATIGELLGILLRAGDLDWSRVDRVAGGGALAYQVGSPRRIADGPGWVAGIPLERSLTDLFEQVAGRQPVHAHRTEGTT